ncbi:hypothetical protein EVAR_24651_1 [Eumeta japonica]|uniref:Uncharacterized protein n=1 Tax=Eumeta variegata TaxID=151549 RepID=A0A4C1V2H8_EUMVA|nr:hypothetical protein EVAR_24651_1 [Eumeta japonica]
MVFLILDNEGESLKSLGNPVLQSIAGSRRESGVTAKSNARQGPKLGAGLIPVHLLILNRDRVTASDKLSCFICRNHHCADIASVEYNKSTIKTTNIVLSAKNCLDTYFELPNSKI